MGAVRTADDILAELGIEAPGDIDVEAIAYHLGALVQYRKLDGCAARIIGNNDKAVITVDSFSNSGRRRFSVGHELGHWMMDRGTAAFMCNVDDLRAAWGFRQDPESRANRFAADLLMPSRLFIKEAGKRPVTFETADSLSEIFGTSRTATAIRLVELSPHAAMIACYGVAGRKWFSRGQDVPDYIWPREDLDYNTQAFSLLYGEDHETRPVLVNAGSWTNYRYADGYKVMEHSVKIGGEVISLIWWKDRAMLADALKRQG